MKRLSRARGFTLIEISATMAILALTGGMLIGAIRSIALLGAKNSAINLTHEQSRNVIHHAVFQIHSSVSIPALVNASLATVGGSGPAAGVSYQTLVAGPYRVWASAAYNTSVIQVDSHAGDTPPVVGDRLIVPAFRIEEDITKVASAGGSPPRYNLTIAHPVTSAITCSSGVPNYVAYITQRSALAVVSSELRFYPLSAKPSTYSVVARNIGTPTPFSVPGADNRFVQALFTAQDPHIAGLNLKSMYTQIPLTIPIRYDLTTHQ